MEKLLETDIKKHFEKIGSNYNLITNRKSFQYYLERRKKYLKEFCVSIEKNNIIVDLAAGIGSYSKSLSNYRHLINMDLSFNALKANTVLNDKTSRINAHALNIPLKNNSVDSILLIGLLHHIPSCLPELFEEVLRVLKVDGTIFIDEPNGYNTMWFIFMKLCEIDKVGTKPLFPHLLRRLAKNYCLTIEKELYWGFVPPWPDKKIIINIFNKIESVVENSFLSYLCTRYLIILKRRQSNENN